MLAPPRLNGLCSSAHPTSMLVPARVRAAVAVAGPVEVAALLASAQRLLLLHRTPARALQRRLAAWPTATRWLLLPRVTDRAIAMLVRARVTTPAPTVARETVALAAAPSPLATTCSGSAKKVITMEPEGRQRRQRGPPEDPPRHPPCPPRGAGESPGVSWRRDQPATAPPSRADGT